VPKLAILNVYYEIFSNVRWARWTMLALVFVLVGDSIGYTIATLTTCRPMAANWDVSIKGKCLDRKTLYSMTIIPNIVTDVVMLILPIPIILKLQMSRRTKIGVLATFLVGTM
jgi:hypothetical protein